MYYLVIFLSTVLFYRRLLPNNCQETVTQAGIILPAHVYSYKFFYMIYACEFENKICCYNYGIILYRRLSFEFKSLTP